MPLYPHTFYMIPMWYSIHIPIIISYYPTRSSYPHIFCIIPMIVPAYSHHTRWRPSSLAKLAPMTPISLWFIVDISILTSSTAQGGGGSFKNRKPIGEIGCCESGMAEWIILLEISSLSLFFSLFLSLSLCDYLPTYLLIFLSTYLSVCLSIYLSIYLSI